MSEEQNQFQHLQQKLTDFQKRQDLFQSEILQIKEEIARLGLMQINVDEAKKNCCN